MDENNKIASMGVDLDRAQKGGGKTFKSVL